MMCDALQELSELSLEFQKRDTTIILAHKAICRAIRVLEAMLERAGRYSELSRRRTESNSFLGKASNKALNIRQFFLSLAKNLEERLLPQGGV